MPFSPFPFSPTALSEAPALPGALTEAFSPTCHMADLGSYQWEPSQWKIGSSIPKCIFVSTNKALSLRLLFHRVVVRVNYAEALFLGAKQINRNIMWKDIFCEFFRTFAETSFHVVSTNVLRNSIHLPKLYSCFSSKFLQCFPWAGTSKIALTLLLLLI